MLSVLFQTVMEIFQRKVAPRRLRPPKAQEALVGRRFKSVGCRDRETLRSKFNQYKANCCSSNSRCYKGHKSRGFKIAHRLPMKFATLNVRGLNGGNGSRSDSTL